jgi:hypothetical protein
MGKGKGRKYIHICVHTIHTVHTYIRIDMVFVGELVIFTSASCSSSSFDGMVWYMTGVGLR